MLLQKSFKFRGSEMPFPALSTGHFNKYERKCKWLEHILPISSVVVKVQCSRKKNKTVTPSCLRLSSSLVIRWLRARRLLFRRAKDTNTMRRIYQLPLFNDKNAFRKSVYIYTKTIFSCTHGHMCVCGRYTPLDFITWLINLNLIPFIHLL